MIFGIYDPPDSSIEPWPDLRVGTIVNAEDFEYEKLFCGVGNFELNVPIGSTDADKLKLGRLLFSVDGGFVIKKIQHGANNIMVSGYDLNGLLLDRLTVANSEDGKQRVSGSTETIVKRLVNTNCASSATAARRFPGLKVKADKGRGIENDAAAPRLEIVADVISDILSAQQMGWRISAVNLADSSTSSSARFEFDVFKSVNRKAGSSRPKTFSYGLGNADAIKTENSIADAKNTLYCELDDGTVQTYSPVSDNEGFGRTEEYADLGCALSELEIYAEHEIAGRFAEVQSVTLEHVDASGFGDTNSLEGFDLGDIVTVVDNNANVKLEALISSVKIKRSGYNELELSAEDSKEDFKNNAHEMSITVGETRVKPLDLVSKITGSVASSVKSVKGIITVISSDSSKNDRLIKNNHKYVFVPVNVWTFDDMGNEGISTDGVGARLEVIDGTNVTCSRLVMSNLYAKLQDPDQNRYVLSIGTPTMEFYDYKRKTGFKIFRNAAGEMNRMEIGFGDNDPIKLYKSGTTLSIEGISELIIGGKKVLTEQED